MRIISGKYKGRPIEAVPSKNTRPTTDRVREAWASTLQSHVPGGSLQGLRLLDVFAGSGALGLELISRGAADATFVEKDKRALRTLRDNIASLSLREGTTRVLSADSLTHQLVAGLKKADPFDIVIFDPPYGTSQAKVKRVIASLGAAGLIKHACLISYEHSAANTTDMDTFELPDTTPQVTLHLVRNKTYGTITLDYYVCL